MGSKIKNFFGSLSQRSKAVFISTGSVALICILLLVVLLIKGIGGREEGSVREKESEPPFSDNISVSSSLETDGVTDITSDKGSSAASLSQTGTSHSSKTSGQTQTSTSTGIHSETDYESTDKTKVTATESKNTAATTKSGSVTTETTKDGGNVEGNVYSAEYIGRFKKVSGGFSASWSGSTVTAGFEGSGIKLTMRSSVPDDYVNVTVDEGEPFIIKITNKKTAYTLAENLPKGKHTVKIVKRTEGSMTNIFFGEFDYMGGKSAEAPKRKKLRFEFIGDSITAGYGNEGPAAWSGFKREEENAEKTYGMLTAKAFDAEATIIGWSGMGVAQDLGGNKNLLMPELYQRTLGLTDNKDWDFSKNVPHLVLINLGTNDFASGVDGELYAEKLKGFVEFVRSKYRDAKIICSIGPINFNAKPYIERVVGEFNKNGDRDVYSFVFDSMAGDIAGTDGHPSAVTHEKMADKLIPFIRDILG